MRRERRSKWNWPDGHAQFKIGRNVYFKIVGAISDVETIASGKGIRDRRRPRKAYGGYRWRKLKGTAPVKLADGTMCYAELHWYEAHGVGAREFRIKNILRIQ